MEVPAWEQKEHTLYCHYKGVSSYFSFSNGVEIDLVGIHPDLLQLAAYLVYGPWGVELLDYSWSRKQCNSDIVGHSFSAGVDSTAALTLIDDICDVETFYIKRDAKGPVHTNALHGLSVADSIRGKNTIILSTDFPNVRAFFHPQHRPGFAVDLSIFIGQILLADKLNIRYLSCGMILESSFFTHDNVYRNFIESDYWKRNTEIFERAGFSLFFPTIPCSEYLACVIADNGKFSGTAHSCARSLEPGGRCGTCYKCFRKQALRGNLIPISGVVESELKKESIKTGMSLIYAYNKYGFDIPDMIRYKGLSLEQLENFYEPGLMCSPDKFRNPLKNKLLEFTKPMTVDLSSYSIKP